MRQRHVEGFVHARRPRRVGRERLLPIARQLGRRARRKMYPKRRTTYGVARFGSRNGTKITGRTRGVRTTTLKRSSGSKKWNVTTRSGLVLRTVRIAACEGAS